MSSLPKEAFGRYDETPDEEFYEMPRLVTHIDDRAIAAVTQLYKEFFPPGGEILVLMSSWVSHLPEEVRYERVVGLGMNEEELKRNPRLDEYGIQNLNRDPRLPFEEARFDGVGICVSIDYLTDPVAVLREVRPDELDRQFLLPPERVPVLPVPRSSQGAVQHGEQQSGQRERLGRDVARQPGQLVGTAEREQDALLGDGPVALAAGDPRLVDDVEGVGHAVASSAGV